MKNKVAFTLTVLLLSNFVYAQNNPDYSLLKGTWNISNGYTTVTLKIIDGTKLIYDGEQLAYKLISQPKAIRVFDEYSYFDYLYTLKGDKLILTFPDGNNYIFEKNKNSGQTVGKAAAQRGNSNLYGSFCHWSGSSGVYSTSSYSSTDRITFDGKGNFAYGTETSFSSDAGIYDNDNNNTQRGIYTVDGNNIYVTFNDGSKYTLQIYVQQDRGEITEIKYGEKVYAKALCE